MPMYNLSGSLWLYSKDVATNFNSVIESTENFKSFKYKAKWLGKTEAYGANETLRNIAIAIPLKYLSNSWRSFEMPLITSTFDWKLNEEIIAL